MENKGDTFMAGILAIDDEEEIGFIIKRTLEKEGHTVTCVKSVKEFDKINFAGFDMILLDIMMPGKDGYTLCNEIRQKVDCPIIFITAKTMDEDLEKGFFVGADDYIKKPFSIVELRARVLAHLRRQERTNHTRFVSKSLCFDITSKSLYRNDLEIKLTKSEYEICVLLAQNKGHVFSLEQIIERIFGYDSESDIATIREHIKNIRFKLKKVGEEPIETVWGIGYRWKV